MAQVRLEMEVDMKVLEKMRADAPHLVERVVLQTALAVEAEATQLVGEGGALRAYKTGNLMHSMGTRLVKGGAESTSEVYNTAKYGRYVHDGTGLYGPMRRKIVPTSKKALAFMIPGVGKLVRRSVKGMRGRAFFKAAIEKVVPEKFSRIFEKAAGKMGTR